MVRGGTNREDLHRVGYRVSNLKSGSGPGRVYPMQIRKVPHKFQFCKTEICEELYESASDKPGPDPILISDYLLDTLPDVDLLCLFHP